MSNVHICLNDILGVAVVCEVIFYPGDTPFFNGSALAVSGARSIWLDAEGNGSVTLLPGRYAVRFSGIPCNTDTLLIQVPTDEALYPLSALICGGNWVLPMRDFLQKARNLEDVADPVLAFEAIKQSATATETGVVCLATQAEVDGGSDTTKYLTPSTFANAARWMQGGVGGSQFQFISVANAAARLALTAAEVRVGDSVEELNTRAVYQVLDAAALDHEWGWLHLGIRAATGVAAGLLGKWPLTEASGTRIDTSGNGNDLSDTNGVGSIAGENGLCARITAGGEFLSNHAISLVGAAGFTLFGRFRFLDFSSFSGIFIGLTMVSSSFSVWVYEGQLYASVDTDSTGHRGFSVTTPPAANTWFWLAVKYDGAALSIQVDANAPESIPVTGKIIDPSSPPCVFEIGGAAMQGGAPVDVYNVQLWNRGLSDAEITSLRGS